MIQSMLHILPGMCAGHYLIDNPRVMNPVLLKEWCGIFRGFILKIHLIFPHADKVNFPYLGHGHSPILWTGYPHSDLSNS